MTRALPCTLLLLALSCGGVGESIEQSFPTPAIPATQPEEWPSELTKERYRDKVLGLLVGSAIGDAMGAPVEMWTREYIEMQHGFINGLLTVRRPGQAEGPWEDNLRPGATTDDTRWKYLVGQYLLTQPDTLDDQAFAQFILDIYRKELKEVQAIETFDPEPLERELLQVQWLQEWAKVAKPYADNDLQGYSYAVNRFYGGELSCAGMLYTPLLGATFPGQTDKAYLQAYKLGFFDLGYARDISALSAAYVAKAMEDEVTIGDLLAVTESTDPLRYFNSRLVERLAYQALTISKQIVYESQQLDSVSIDPSMKVPRGFAGSKLDYARLQKAYELLENHLQDIPFHAGEVHLINLTALAYSDGDFKKAMTFIVNFGRDNDTVGAVTGAILGAYLGYSQLPEDLRLAVAHVSKTTMGIDLEDLADQLVARRFP